MQRKSFATSHSRRRPVTLDLDLPQQLLVSQSTSAAINLAFENHVFQKGKLPCLLLYRNTPSVIIGRNQNPWVEVNLPYLSSHKIQLFRRYSGGGTVYHDLGNTNYSYMMPRSAFDRDTTALKLVKALKTAGLEVDINARHDITLKTEDGWRKCSGSAYKIAKDRAYAHGTMLLQSDLTNLGPALRAAKAGIEGNGVESVRSKVANLNLSHERFCTLVADAFAMRLRHVSESEMLAIDAVRASVEQLEGDEWKYQQTPAFSQTVVLDGQKTVASVKAGKYVEVTGSQDLADELVGRAFDPDLLSRLLKRK